MDHKTQHPETRPGETFLGNSDANGFAACGHKSKRLGLVAYDVQGGVIPAINGLKPLFASAEEVAACVARYS